MWICFNHNIPWQLYRKAIPVSKYFDPPSHFMHFQNWPPQIKPLRKLCPLQTNPSPPRPRHLCWHVINDRFLGDGPLEMTGGGVTILKKGFFTGHWSDILSRCYKALYVFIVLFKIRDASGERKYLITASNLTELTLTLNKNSKNGLLNCSFIRFI